MFTERERTEFMNENQIAQLALERLTERTGLTGRWKPLSHEIDGRLDLHFDNGEERFYTEVKKELRHHQVNQLLEMAKENIPFVVIAEKIFPALKEILRKHKIGYLDTAGNIFINTPDHYVWVDGHKPINEKKQATNRAFTKTGLKTVFYFLWNEQTINMPYRALAELTETALGNIKNVMEGLNEAGFILQLNNKKVVLQNKKELLDRWITGYRETLKPTLFIGAYKFWKREQVRQWHMLPLHMGETMWGGEPGGEFLTQYLQPEKLTLYTNEYRTLMKDWILIPQDDITEGDIFFYKKFWKNDPYGHENIAPPLLVYADLLITGDPRCVETADMIYKKYLKNEFERN